jgi:hypothetical protein|tara:strand:+ start:415 stop:768 length:354 start_codon:yes stop_codon:yes gene_type:complete
MNYNSDFKYDLEIGKIGEEALGNLLSDQKIEVKTDFHLADTNNLAVEYASRGKYSGISTTEAEWFAFVEGNDQDTIILVKTERLKSLCKKSFARKVPGGDNNTSRLVLIPFHKILER